ncbi:hypothetical protein BH10BAC2_BH10BAC2_49860 [soil metagenome]
MLVLVCAFFTKIGFAQELTSALPESREAKWAWKKNELLIGIGSAFAFTMIVYAFWRKKKKGSNNMDSIM